MNPTLSPSLSTRQKQLIRESFDTVSEYSDSVVLLFYGRLFEIAPEVRRLFKVEIREQARKLLATLSLFVDSLDCFEQIRPQLTELGRRHAAYEVKPEHYDALLSALMWAFGQALGVEFSREARAAWTTLLKAVSAVMLEGATCLDQTVKQEHSC
jgi:nitric oxide dioxygenase